MCPQRVWPAELSPGAQNRGSERAAKPSGIRGEEALAKDRSTAQGHAHADRPAPAQALPAVRRHFSSPDPSVLSEAHRTEGGRSAPPQRRRPGAADAFRSLLLGAPRSVMVHAFLIQTLRAPNAEDTGFCRVLYSYVFGAEKSPDDPRPHGAERDRLLRKEQILAVARQVESMCQLQQLASGRPCSDQQPQISDEPVSLHEAPHGIFGLAAGDPFQEPRTVVWLGVLSLGFTLVLDAHDNLLLAESTLRLLARLLLDHLRLLAPGSSLLLRADHVEGILSHFLPHGQLLFINDQFVQALEKEFNASWPR